MYGPTILSVLLRHKICGLVRAQRCRLNPRMNASLLKEPPSTNDTVVLVIARFIYGSISSIPPVPVMWILDGDDSLQKRDLVGLESSPKVHHVEVELYDGGKLSETVDDDDPGASLSTAAKNTQRMSVLKKTRRHALSFNAMQS